MHQKLSVCSEVGLISYNETPLKMFILKGITTLSTDFDFRGRATVQLIKSKSKAPVEVPFHVIIRDSI